ncbi:MAG: hypothetical protein LQ338_007298 [Usnochroma carphineum]|nr:MAG: hypothetical protein LQ338_007298 [Usnochroma carphineum]
MSPIELYSGPTEQTQLASPTVIWLTAFPHTIGSPPGGPTNIVLLSRNYTDLRKAQRSLRNPRKSPGYAFNFLYRGPLLQARENILQRYTKPKSKNHGFFWAKHETVVEEPPVQSAKEARDLDDDQDRRIADAFAEVLPQLPPSLEEDLSFNAFYRGPGIRGPQRRAYQFPVVFRAMVPLGWRGLSVNPYPDNVHVMELTEDVVEDLSGLYGRTWGWGFPEEEEEDVWRTFLKRTRSWSSRYEVESPREGTVPRRASTVEIRREREINVGEKVRGVLKRVESGIQELGLRELGSKATRKRQRIMIAVRKARGGVEVVKGW